MKKIIIIGLSLFVGAQAFAFGMNATGSASVEENQLHGELEAVVPTCVTTQEYVPVCATVRGDKETKTFPNKGYAKCAGASIIHAGPCEDKEKKVENKGKARVGFDMKLGAPNAVIEKIASQKMKLEVKDGNGLEFDGEDGDKEFSIHNKAQGKGFGYVKANEQGKAHGKMKGILKFIDSDEAVKRVKTEVSLGSDLKVKLSKDEKGKAYYSVSGKKKAKFLGLFNVSVDIDAKVDAKTGDVMEVKTPWYSIFLF